MTITVNPDLNLVVEQPLSRQPLAVVKLPRGSKVPIWVQFARDGAVIDPSEDLTSGTLVVGLYYKITTFVAGDSFTNVGAASNATSVYFLCTATTPTTWTNSSTLQQCDSAGVLFSLIFSVKKNGEYDGAVLVLATGTDFTKFGTGTSTIFKSKCSFSTAEINTLLGVDSSVANDEDEVTLMGEVSWLGPDESKAFPFQIDLQNDSYKVNDVVTSTPGVQAMSLVTTSTEALLTGSHVITGSSTVTVASTTGLVTLSVPSELVVPSQTGNSGKYLTTNGAATSWGTVSTGLTVGTTAIASGTTTRVLFDNAGILGEYAISGTGSVAMTTSPSFTTPTIGDGTEAAPSLSFTSDTNTGVYRPAADTVGIVGGGNDVVRMTGIASATDYLEIKNGIGVGSPLHVLAEGASANIGVHLQPKGSGLFTISDGTDFNKGIRFRSSSSAASAITLLDAVASAGRVVTLPDATGTLALVSGDLGTPTVLVGTNITGTASGLTAGNATLAATVTVANEATDTTCFPLFATAATGSLATMSNAGLTFNSATGLLSATGLAGAFNGTVGATTPSTVTGTNGTFSGLLRATGAASQIGTTGVNGFIYTSGTYGAIFTTGLNGHILTQGADAYIESRSTFKLNGGTFITTLSHAATANRAIAFPDAAGTLLLADGSGANLTTLNASNVSSGTLADARLSANVPLEDAANTFTGTTNTFTLPTTTGTTTTSGIAIAGNSLTTGTGIYLASSTLTSGKAMDIQVSGTAAAASQTALNVATAGANGTSGITTKGAVISNTHTGTTSTNTALELTASGGTTNVALNATAGHVLVPDGSYAYNTSVSPSIGRSAVAANSASQAGILLGDNTVSILTNSIRGFTMSGYGAFGNGALITVIGTSTLTFYNTVISTSTLQAGEDKTSTPNTGTVRGGSGSGTNIAGGVLHIQGGASTGSAAGGSILLRTTPAGGAGSSANAAVTALTIDSTQAATFAGTLAVTGATTLTGGLAVNTTGSITTNQTTFAIANTTATTLNIGGAATTIAMGAAGAGTMNIPLTTSASSATTGALTIGNGTAATNVGIGGGNINAGGTIASGGAFNVAVSGTVDQALIARNGSTVIRTGSNNTELYTTYALVCGSVKIAQGSYLMLTGPGPLVDTSLSRNAAGVLQIGNASANATGSLVLTNLTASGTLAVTGATTLTGNLTSNGALISTPQALTGAGAVNVTTLTTAVTTTAPAQALTLADGTNGQIKTIVHQALSGGGTWVLTPTTKTGYTTITSSAVGETCTLQFFTTIGWCILSLRGAIAA